MDCILAIYCSRSRSLRLAYFGKTKTLKKLFAIEVGNCWFGPSALRFEPTIGVFGTDGTIASKQRTTIAQLLSHRSLSQDQKDRLAAVSKSFPSLSFVTATVQDDEAWGFAMDIGAELKSDGWNWVPCPGGVPPLDARPASCMTIAACIEIDAPDSLKPVGNALVAALKDPDVIGMDNVRSSHQNANPSTMIVIVGSKR